MFRSIVHLGMLVVMLAAPLLHSGADSARAAGATPPARPALNLPVTFERFAYVTRDRARFRSPQLRAHASLTADPCLTYTYGVNGRSSTGTMTYSWAEEVGWCYNGSRVTYASTAYLPRAGFGWTYLGIDNKTERWASDGSFFQARSVGSFGLTCISGGCSFYRFPYVSVVVYSNGTYSGAGSAND